MGETMLGVHLVHAISSGASWSWLMPFTPKMKSQVCFREDLVMLSGVTWTGTIMRAWGRRGSCGGF